MSVALELELAALRTRNAELERIVAGINTPEIENFLAGVPKEAAHQRERWGEEHDGQKSDEDWIFLFGWLAGKASQAKKTGHWDKAKHHAITAAAALLNWHLRIIEAERTDY